MVKYYILIKRRGSNRWIGAIPAKKGASLVQLRKLKMRPGFVKKVITEKQLRLILRRMKPLRSTKATRRSRKPKRRVRRKRSRRRTSRKRRSRKPRRVRRKRSRTRRRRVRRHRRMPSRIRRRRRKR